MPTVSATRTLAADAGELWSLVRDPHHLPRWWPRVRRVEAVTDDAFTEVMISSRGRTVRADFRIARADEQERVLVWEQLLEGTPFARVLRSAQTELRLVPGGVGGAPATDVTIELRQELGARGAGVGAALMPRLGSIMVRRAAAATVAEALDGLERIGV